LAHNRAVIGRYQQTLLGMTTFLVVACGSTAPSVVPNLKPSPVAPNGSATRTPKPSSESPGPDVVQFATHGFTFEYPSAWHVIAEEVFDGVDLVWVVGTGEWDDGCTTTGSETYCSESSIRVDPGEVVIEISTQFHGPYIPVFESPPFDSTVLPSGSVASVQGFEWATGALVYAPGRDVLRVQSVLGSPLSDADHASVQRVIDSLVYTAADLESGPTWNPTSIGSAECERRIAGGRLNNGHSPVLNLLEPTSFTQLTWPAGWSTEQDEHGRGQIVDDTGRVIARQWDQVELGGRGDKNGFRVCPDSVRLIRSFPS
jgi:hypothetical protein